MAQRFLRAAAAGAAIVLLLASSAGRTSSPASQDKETVGPKSPGRMVVPVMAAIGMPG